MVAMIAPLALPVSGIAETLKNEENLKEKSLNYCCSVK